VDACVEGVVSLAVFGDVKGKGEEGGLRGCFCCFFFVRLMIACLFA
jgi:hypothetical protein